MYLRLVVDPIGLHKCQMKGLNGGELLCFISRDVENWVIFICYAWVEVKTPHT